MALKSPEENISEALKGGIYVCVCVCVRVKVLVTWSSLFPKHPLTLKQVMFYMNVLYIQGFSFYSGSLQQMRTWNNERQE